MENKSHDMKKALKIGSVCIFTYLINYYIRKLLPVLSTDMIGSGAVTETLYALLSSTYMIAYAVGQLINGVIGDYIKPKYMVSLGLLTSSAGLFLFSFPTIQSVDVISFGVIGFGLSMMRGPLVKVISENTKQKYARVCCTFLSFVSFAGPLLVGAVAAFMDWESVFVFSAFATLLVAVGSFVMLTAFEKRGLIVPISSQSRDGKREKGDFWKVFRLNNFVLYIFIGIIVETMAISLDQWLTIFFSGHLMITEENSKTIYYVISVLRAVCPFLSLLIFKIVKGRDLLLIRIAYGLAAVFFVLMLIVPIPSVNVVFLILALMCASVASSTMWSIYIPSLGKSGKVSGVNGILDSFGYAGASVMNLAFAWIWSGFSGKGLIVAWACLVGIGSLITLLGNKNATEE